MKTLVIHTSPKKRFSQSAYFASVLSVFVKKEAKTIRYKGPGDWAAILEELADAEACPDKLIHRI